MQLTTRGITLRKKTIKMLYQYIYLAMAEAFTEDFHEFRWWKFSLKFVRKLS